MNAQSLFLDSPIISRFIQPKKELDTFIISFILMCFFLLQLCFAGGRVLLGGGGGGGIGLLCLQLHLDALSLHTVRR